MTPFEQAVKNYLNSPREWLPHCALQHAEYKFKSATTDMEHKYWKAIIEIERGRLQTWVEKNKDIKNGVGDLYWQNAIKLAKRMNKQ